MFGYSGGSWESGRRVFKTLDLGLRLQMKKAVLVAVGASSRGPAAGHTGLLALACGGRGGHDCTRKPLPPSQTLLLLCVTRLGLVPEHPDSP